MNPQIVRPEDRRRGGVDSLAQQAWADARPGGFRSEGFAEDLPDEPLATTAPAPGMGTSAVAAVARIVTEHPLLGVALAGLLGVFGR